MRRMDYNAPRPQENTINPFVVAVTGDSSLRRDGENMDSFKSQPAILPPLEDRCPAMSSPS